MVDFFLEHLKYGKRYSSHTLLSYRNDLNQFISHLQGQDVPVTPADAQYSDIRTWVVALSEIGTNPSTISRKLATLRSFYKFLLSQELIQVDPTLKIRSPKLKKKTPVFVHEENLLELLDMFEFTSDFKGMRDKLIIEMIYGTGIRLSELVALKDKDVSIFNQTIKVLGKRNKERIIPLNVSLVSLIKTYISLRDETLPTNEEGFFIVTDNNAPCYPVFIYRTVKKYLSMVTTTEKKSPHVLRHTFATHLLNKGADINAIKDLLGHSSLAATQVYTHNSLEKMKEIFKQAHPKA